MYRNYRRRGYRYNRYRSYNRNEQEPLGALLIILLVRGIYRLFRKIYRWAFQSSSKTKGSYQLSTVLSPAPRPPQVPEVNVSDRYNLRDSLLTQAEQSFLQALKQAAGDRFVIESQVPLSRIVSPKDSNRNFTNYRDFNRIKAKTIDFVLYEQGYKPYLCIELDDRSHLQLDRVRRDAFVDDLMKSVELPLIHIPVSFSYDVEQLRDEISQFYPERNPEISKSAAQVEVGI